MVYGKITASLKLNWSGSKQFDVYPAGVKIQSVKPEREMKHYTMIT